MTEDLRPPYRIAFDTARDPYAARNALGILGPGGTLVPSGGGGGAPPGAQYIVAAADPTLTAERVLTNTATITWDFSTPGQAKASTAAGGGNVSNSGTPTAGQYAKWVTATTIQGVAPAMVLADIGAQPAGNYQPLDGDLTAIAALAGTNVIYYRSAADTWTAVTISTGLSFSGGALSCTVSTAGSQPLDATLTAFAAYNTNGLLTQTAADTFTGRTLTAPAAGITVTNGNGVAGNPTLVLADDLAALEALGGTNTIYYRSGTSAWTAVTIGGGLTFTGGTLAASGGGGDVFLAGNNTFTGDNFFAGTSKKHVIAHTAALTNDNSNVQVNGSATTGALSITAWSAATAADQSNLYLQRSRNATVGTRTAVTTNDNLGGVTFRGDDGAAFRDAAQVSAVADGAFFGSGLPGRMLLSTAAAGGTMTERMRIDSAGAVTITRTPPAASDNTTNVATTAWVNSWTAARSLFRATMSANQTAFGAGAYAQVIFNTAGQNVGGHYNTGNYRWTPPAGRVMLTANIWTGNGTSGGSILADIRKNGVALNTAVQTIAASTNTGISLATMDVANGSDYYEMFFQFTLVGGGGGTVFAANSWFAGALL